jgi:hypothetical protein
MRIKYFRWLDHIVDKVVGKHGIVPEDVEDALTNDDPAPWVIKTGDLYEAYCQVPGSGQYLYIVFGFEEPDTARIVTAYEMEDEEKSKYRRRLGL